MNKKYILSLSLLLTSLCSCVSNTNSSITSSIESVSSNSEISLSNESKSSENSTISENSTTLSSKETTSSSNVTSSSSFSREDQEYIPTNKKFELNEWTDFKFYDEYGPDHNEYWPYYYNTSLNPNSVLFRSPNEKANVCGVHFEKMEQQYMFSPMFQSWKKIEVRFKLWFSSKSSDKYKAKKNQPQIILQHYSEAGTYLNNHTDIELQRSDVPNTGTTYECKVYLRDTNMSYFKFKFNNTIDNGNSGYTIVVSQVSMKGWDYE